MMYMYGVKDNHRHSIQHNFLSYASHGESRAKVNVDRLIKITQRIVRCSFISMNQSPNVVKYSQEHFWKAKVPY